MLRKMNLNQSLRYIKRQFISKNSKNLIPKFFSEEQQKNKKMNEFYNEELESILKTSMKYTNKKTWDLGTKTLKEQKYSTRQRIEMILDHDSFFLELSQMAGYDMYDQGKAY
jgi:acetyl-CoA carboxylase carboxyltransferase component